MKPLKNIEFLIINLLKNMVISISNILAFVMLLSFSMAEISPQVYGSRRSYHRNRSQTNLFYVENNRFKFEAEIKQISYNQYTTRITLTGQCFIQRFSVEPLQIQYTFATYQVIPIQSKQKYRQCPAFYEQMEQNFLETQISINGQANSQIISSNKRRWNQITLTLASGQNEIAIVD